MNEAVAYGSKEPDIKVQRVNTAIELLNVHCKDALWMLTEDRPIYRGDDNAFKHLSKTGFATVDPSLTERRSQNTSNYYTVILDNHPNMTDFPKRSKSYIAATEEDESAGYGANLILIPYDNVKIGIVGEMDIWMKKIEGLFGLREYSIDSLNTRFGFIDEIRSATWEKLEHFDKQLKKRNRNAIDNFEHAFGYDLDKYYDHFLDEIFKAYDPKKLKLTHTTTKNMKRNIRSEVWIGGPCIAIAPRMWSSIRQAYLISKRH